MDVFQYRGQLGVIQESIQTANLNVLANQKQAEELRSFLFHYQNRIQLLYDVMNHKINRLEINPNLLNRSKLSSQYYSTKRVHLKEVQTYATSHMSNVVNTIEILINKLEGQNELLNGTLRSLNTQYDDVEWNIQKINRNQ